MTGAENGAEQAENGVSGSGAESGLNRPLKVRSHAPTLRWFSD